MFNEKRAQDRKSICINKLILSEEIDKNANSSLVVG